MPKKKLIEEALIEAKELERVSIENAKDVVLETFTPDFVNFFKDVLNEEEEKDVDKDMKDDEDLEEGNEHDLGKEPDPGRQGTDPAVDDDEENQNQNMKEGKFDDVSGDATPEKGQAGLPKKGQPKTKKVGDKGWEDEGSSGAQGEDPEKAPGDMPGKKPAVKQTGDGGWEDEGASGAQGPDPEKGGKNGLDGVPKPKVVKVAEAEDKKDDKKELEVPDKLFDDKKEESTDGKDAGDNVDLKDDFDGNSDEEDVEIDIKIDDDEKDKANEGVDIEIEDDDGDKPDTDDAEVEDEIDEGLYIRQEGKFKKITPAEYLQTRIGSLEEENTALVNAIESLKGQLQETHLFNAKMAHLNKLYISGAFTNTEKERIAGRLDECDSIDEVKDLYKTIIEEVKDVNPLDDFSNLIKEQRIKKNTKVENIYESSDVARMKKLINYKFDDLK